MKFKIKIENEKEEMVATFEMQENMEINLDVGDKNIVISNKVKQKNGD